MKAEADASLTDVFARIGRPEESTFVPDDFQVSALDAIRRTDCLVTAPTGAGKTWIAEQAIKHIMEKRGRAWYASPLKALSNSKWVEFGEIFGSQSVGILTGDTKENADAPIIVGTTEILRNQLYDAMHRGENLDCDLVILDEAHFLGDEDRGVVWEEIMIYLPARVNLLLLSATIGNNREIAEWLETLREKECVVIEENRRPVPLHPLFLHPSGRLLPLLHDAKLNRKLRAFTEKQPEKGRIRFALPPIAEILGILRKYDLLPALFFLKSRGECDAAIEQCKAIASGDADETFLHDIDRHLEQFPYLREHRQLGAMLKNRVGAHHGGQLPAWKFTVESMMKRGHLEAVFATTTVAAGVNFPARTVVLFNSDQFNGREFLSLSPTEFHQMTGRAGRRGADNIGFMLAYPGRFMDLDHIASLLSLSPEPIKSQIKNDFSMVLNILLSHSPTEVKDVFEHSLAAFQRQGGKGEKDGRLWGDFLRYVDFLRQERFIDEKDHLTNDGLWASQLRLDQPLLIAECLRNGAFPRNDKGLLAAIVALFVYDRDHDIFLPKKRFSRRLREACERVIRILTPLAGRMKEAGFPVAPLPLWVALALFEWSRGAEWDHITSFLKIADGDLAMLISRTADNLNQLSSLKETHREIADLAREAREAILREPVAFD
ncbi:MAG: DEAD/DEAH box helicase [Deltaproteobacteria bacterium]|nr:DEAD/DEAH box helicase [Deltaproteobacteria bacterium]